MILDEHELDMLHIEKSEVFFVINPKAGSKKIDALIKSIIDTGMSYVITDNLLELDVIMSKEINNYTVFVAVGGDGTVNTLAKYVFNQNDKAIAVLPTGSGNGFAYELGFTCDLEALISHITTGAIHKVDVLSINKSDFINIAGIGLDADVAHRFQKSKKRGLFYYIVASVISYIKFKPFKATISNEKGTITDTFQMISIANTRQFGNKAYISPNSNPFDGQYEIVAIKPLPLFQSFLFVYKLFSGSLKPSKYIQYIPCTTKTSIVTSCTKYHSDGNPKFSEGNFEIHIKKKNLNVIKTTA